jgi:hypothetical protein
MVYRSVLGSSSTERLRIYLSGGAVAFSFQFVALELLGFVNGLSPATQEFQTKFQSLILVFNFLGGLIGGFLATRVSPINKLQTGAVTGVTAYLIQQVVYFFYYTGNPPTSIFFTVSLIFGSIIGAYIYTLYLRRKFISK